MLLKPLLLYRSFSDRDKISENPTSQNGVPGTLKKKRQLFLFSIFTSVPVPNEFVKWYNQGRGESLFEMPRIHNQGLLTSQGRLGGGAWVWICLHLGSGLFGYTMSLLNCLSKM